MPEDDAGYEMKPPRDSAGAAPIDVRVEGEGLFVEEGVVCT